MGRLKIYKVTKIESFLKQAMNRSHMARRHMNIADGRGNEKESRYNVMSGVSAFLGVVPKSSQWREKEFYDPGHLPNM